MKLRDGPLEGTEWEPKSCARIVYPFIRPNDAGDDQVFGQWIYSPEGIFVEEKITTTTWNADNYRDTMEWLWRDYSNWTPLTGWAALARNILVGLIVAATVAWLVLR